MFHCPNKWLKWRSSGEIKKYIFRQMTLLLFQKKKSDLSGDENVNEDSKRTNLAFFSLFLTALEFINLPSTGFWRPFRK